MFEMVLMAVCGIGAAASFFAFALPFLERAESKKRVMDVIVQKRKSLYEDTRAEVEKRKAPDTSAAESVTLFFKIEHLAGDLARKWRTELSQAGYRDPRAVLVFLAARIALPILFCLVAMMFIGAKDERPDDGVTFMILAGAAIAGYMLPRVMVKNQSIKRQQDLNLSFPDSLDLMLICVQGGLAIEPTIDRVSKEIMEHSPILAEELGLLSAELGLLSNRKEAFLNFSGRVGTGSVRNFANAMVQAEQYGTGVSKALRVLADDLRDQRMAEAERKAASLPPKLTVPMIVFFLPALFVVILGPAAIQAMGSGMGGN